MQNFHFCVDINTVVVLSIGALFSALKKYIFSQEDSIPEKDDPMSGDDDDDNDDQLAPPLIIFHELFFGGCLDSLSRVVG